MRHIVTHVEDEKSKNDCQEEGRYENEAKQDNCEAK